MAKGAGKESRLGDVLRDIRRRRNWTFSEMSLKTGVPASTLWRMENRPVSLTLDKLLRLSQSLGIDVTELIAGAGGAGATQVSGRRSFDLPGSGVLVSTPQYDYTYHCAALTPKRMVPMTGLAKCRSLEEFGELINHDGEEYTYVIEGTIEVHTEFYLPLRLNAGGSVYFDSTMKHAYLSIGATPARLLCVCAGFGDSCMGAGIEPEHDAGTGPRAGKTSTAASRRKGPIRSISRKKKFSR